MRRILIGCLTVVLAMITCATIFVTRVHSFLAIEEPVSASTIVISGTLPDFAVEKIVSEVGHRKDIRILTVGGSISRGSHLSEYDNYAMLAAATLKQLNIPETVVTAIPAQKTERDRVFASAQALRDWLDTSGTSIDSVIIYTIGVRGRRTLILFQKALGPDIKIGVVSIEDCDYNPRKWWTTSEGFRSVISEVIAYIYVKMKF